MGPSSSPSLGTNGPKLRRRLGYSGLRLEALSMLDGILNCAEHSLNIQIMHAVAMLEWAGRVATWTTRQVRGENRFGHIVSSSAEWIGRAEQTDDRLIQRHGNVSRAAVRCDNGIGSC